MITVKNLYNYPAHAVGIFERVVQQQVASGHSLHSLSKGFLLGTGVSLRFEFAESPDRADYRFTYFYGRRRELSDAAFSGWQLATVLPMKCCWVTIGYFYLLKRDHEHAA